MLLFNSRWVDTSGIVERACERAGLEFRDTGAPSLLVLVVVVLLVLLPPPMPAESGAKTLFWSSGAGDGTWPFGAGDGTLELKELKRQKE